MSKRINILGATGSIGQSARKVIESSPDRFVVQLVSAHKNVEQLAETAKALKAIHALITDETLYDDLKAALLDTDIEVSAGQAALLDAASMPADLTLAAIVGMAGLAPLLKAIEHSDVVAIANKEPLVAAGPLVMSEAQKYRTTILPVDSEHNAIFQVFDPVQRAHIESLILTASGGPFRTWSLEEMEKATPAQAVAHPNWSMGAKISVDSATMMNKALEVIEAHYLFDMPADKIDVLIHPQSTIHSMVSYEDGSILAQLGASDMCTPIAYALAWPERMGTPGQKLDWKALSNLSFDEPDLNRFPSIARAYDCLSAGQYSALAMNAANEEAVAAFLNNRIGFLDIMKLIDHILETSEAQPLSDLAAIQLCDRDVRVRAQSYIEKAL